MSKRTRRHHTSEQKAAMLKEHLVDKTPISDICDKHKLQPSLFYGWQRQLFENAEKALGASKDGGASSRERELEARIAQLEAKLAKKDAIIAEISGEYVALKKELGEP
jgi:transposase-like protein